MTSIGPFRFAGTVSDNTGNTRKARATLHKEYPWVINMQDDCHELSLTLKEISKLPEFKEVSTGGMFLVLP